MSYSSAIFVDVSVVQVLFTFGKCGKRKKMGGKVRHCNAGEFKEGY
jgi:hypothetical protein